MVAYRFDIILDEKSSIHRFVWHENIEVVKLFLMQHGFHEKSIYQIYPIETPSLNGEFQLKEVKLRSNVNNEEISVYTTRDILEDILRTFVENMDATISELPFLITHTGHDVIKCLNDLIYKLPFVFLTHYIKDEEMDEYESCVNPNDIQYVKIFDSQAKDNGYAVQATEEHTSYLDYEAFTAYSFEALEYATDANMCEDTPLPITIEGYISCFIKYYSS